MKKLKKKEKPEVLKPEEPKIEEPSEEIQDTQEEFTLGTTYHDFKLDVLHHFFSVLSSKTLFLHAYLIFMIYYCISLLTSFKILLFTIYLFLAHSIMQLFFIYEKFLCTLHFSTFMMECLPWIIQIAICYTFISIIMLVFWQILAHDAQLFFQYHEAFL